MKKILGKKLMMTRIFREDGRQIPVTLLKFEKDEKSETVVFQPGEKVNVTGVSKGRGFSGTVKRHHFHLGPKTHGSDNYRRPGSIGSTDAQRVFKGKRMAGRLGFTKTTLKNLEIVSFQPEVQEILLKGSVPGPRLTKILIWRQEGKNEN